MLSLSAIHHPHIAVREAALKVLCQMCEYGIIYIPKLQ